jgi:hypothetical protein
VNDYNIIAFTQTAMMFFQWDCGRLEVCVISINN